MFSNSVGRLCKWTMSKTDPVQSVANVEEYPLSSSPLILHCENGEAGKLSWTPDEYTPDVVFYQVQFVHR